MRTRTLVAVPGLAGLIALSCLAARGQEPKTQLPPDVLPSTFRMFMVTDNRFEPLKDADGKVLVGADGKPVQNPKNRTGKIHCLVSEYGLNPTVAVFVRADAKSLGADSGVGKLTKQVNALIPKNRADKLGGFVAFLRLESGPKSVVVKTKQVGGAEVEEKIEQDKEYPDDEKRDTYAGDIRDLEKAVATPNVPFGLTPEKSKAITAWKIGDADEVTVIFYNRMRVIGKPWRFATDKDLTNEKIAEIVKAVEAAIAGKR
jgi:hypothetical protein